MTGVTVITMLGLDSGKVVDVELTIKYVIRKRNDGTAQKIRSYQGTVKVVKEDEEADAEAAAAAEDAAPAADAAAEEGGEDS